MHEQALMRDVIARVEEVARAERATRVTRVRVRLGALSHFSPGHFRGHFADAARGSVAEDAVVEAELDADVGDPRAGDVVLESIEVER